MAEIMVTLLSGGPKRRFSIKGNGHVILVNYLLLSLYVSP